MSERFDHDELRRYREQRAAAKREAAEVLPSASGGGTYDGMEARVAKLEATAEHMQSQLADIKVDVRHTTHLTGQIVERLAVIETTLKTLPTSSGLVWGGVGLWIAIVAAVAAIVALI